MDEAMSALEATNDITMLLNRYGHIIDNRHWDELSEIFTEDVVFDATDFGSPVRTSLAKLRSDWEALGHRHPMAHHATNVVVELLASGNARVDSKGICVREDGSVFSAVYRDEAVRTPRGWRISRRTALLRRAGGQCRLACAGPDLGAGHAGGLIAAPGHPPSPGKQDVG